MVRHPERLDISGLAHHTKLMWTTVRHDDPLKRGFEYVPFASDQDLYGPVNELWG